MSGPRPVAVLGATGYTGRLVAAELARRGVSARLGGRRPERLTPVSGEGAEPFVVDVRNGRRLGDFVAGTSVVLNLAGPFARLGRSVVEAAARAGVPYVDASGEPGYVAEVYRRFADAPVPVVPACGFEDVPGDLGAALAAAGLGRPATEVRVHYDVSAFVPSRGTVRSALEVFAADRGPSERHRVTWPGGGACTTRWGVDWPGVERVTVARHQPDARLVVTLAAPGPVAAGARRATGLLTPLAPVLARAASLWPEGPPARLRARSRFRVLAEATGGDGRSFVLCEGTDVYALTARFLVSAALAVSAPGYERRGAMAPAEALDPAAFLRSVSGAPPDREDGATFACTIHLPERD